MVLHRWVISSQDLDEVHEIIPSVSNAIEDIMGEALSMREALSRLDNDQAPLSLFDRYQISVTVLV